jgi:hypothetical protein
LLKSNFLQFGITFIYFSGLISIEKNHGNLQHQEKRNIKVKIDIFYHFQANSIRNSHTQIPYTRNYRNTT